MLQLERVTSGYGRSPVLHEVSLEVRQGEVVALIGANGAGKSTLLNTVMGLVRRTQGAIRFEGREIGAAATPAIVRAGLAQVPERRQLFGTMSVEENLRMGAYARRGDVAERLAVQYALFPILSERRRQAAETLSGGEQQMLAIARANMTAPRLLLLDEPSLGLAPLIVADIFRIIGELKQSGVAILLVEQNARAALKIADRAYVMELGEFVLSGKASDIAANERVAASYLGFQHEGASVL
jgi:branched-chain amino acid transport system ATP-binding protein